MDTVEARQCVGALWEEHCDAVRRDEGRRREFEERCLTFGAARMRFGLKVIGEPGGDGYPVYIALHGGGGCPAGLNDQQWEHMGVYYRDSVESGIYVNPRGVRNTWDTHANAESFPLYDRLIEDLIVFCGADANRIYLLGFSAGGDGVYLVGPRMADRFAALHMSAGHPNRGSMVNLYNTPIQLQVGIDDTAYDRNRVTAMYGNYLDRLQGRRPDGYIHNVYIHVDRPHNFSDNAKEDQVVLIDGRVWLAKGTVTRRKVDSNAVRFLEGFSRNPVPERVIWELDNRYRDRKRRVQSFFWLSAPREVKKGKVAVRLDRETNSVIVERDDTKGRVEVFLRDGMLELDSPVGVVYPDGSRRSVRVRRSEEVARRTLAERGDFHYIFTACLPLGEEG